MATDDEDDLEAFFDEVQKVEQQALQEDDTAKVAVDNGNGPSHEDEPPHKKPKTVPAPTAVRVPPRGIVVAAAASHTFKVSAATSDNNNKHHYDGNDTNESKHRADPHLNDFTHTTSNVVPPPPPPMYPSRIPNMVVPSPPATTALVTDTEPGTWVDSKVDEWPKNDFRIFVGNVGVDVTDVQLYHHFASRYTRVLHTKIVRDSKGTSQGYGFVSFGDALECAKALRELDQTWLGSRPIRLKRSTWKDRQKQQQQAKQKRRR
jgi:hypothetical protein